MRKGGNDNFDESLTISQAYQTFPLSHFCTSYIVFNMPQYYYYYMQSLS